MTFDTLLVANRGEIAARVIRCARGLGLRTVAVFTDADAAAPHVALADAAVRIGAGPAGDSYLNAGKILDAARQSGAGAIHPGYGFLSENAGFAQAVADAGLVFVGPPAAAIRAMGNKAAARRLMIAAGVPCVPGHAGADQSDPALAAAAARLGFPVMVKAAAGGGGRGMRLVVRAADLAGALAAARSEAANAFGSGELILETAIVAPRHVEFQVFADRHGNIIHLGERDCSVQRRHQKVVEEAPSPALTPVLRAAMGAAAVAAARAVGYVGAGTVEFLLDAQGRFHFLEMNTRLQVEHPVTEMVTGLDLVAMQIAVAQGAALPLTQDLVRLTGHAIEVRLYAEDPADGYLPQTGRIDLWRPAEGPGLRVDAGIAEAQEVTPHYDPMLAKIIAWGETREMARARLIRAVEGSVVLGCATNAEFLAAVLALPDFVSGQATTALLERAWPAGFAGAEVCARDIALAAALLMQADRDAALAAAGYVAADQLGWSSAPLLPHDLTLECRGRERHVRVGAVPGGWHVLTGAAGVLVRLEPVGDGRFRAQVAGDRVDIVARVHGDRVQMAVGARRLDLHRRRAGAPAGGGGAGGLVLAPMPGLVLEVSAVPGAGVARGDTLAVVEAMKMQHRIVAPVAGRIAAVHVRAGQQIAAGVPMVEIEAG